jgi:hypothetical protein
MLPEGYHELVCYAQASKTGPFSTVIDRQVDIASGLGWGPVIPTFAGPSALF